MNFRKSQRLVDGQWIDCEFETLRVGDRFRLYEAGVLYSQGIVVSTPIPCAPEGNYAFQADQVEMAQ